LRVAGSIAGAAGAGAATVALFLAAVAAAGAAVGVAAVVAAVVGTTLRAIGRGLGNGTFELAQASATANDPTASARLAAKAVDRNAAAREDGITAFLRGESSIVEILGVFD
jgi:hypothetical protein